MDAQGLGRADHPAGQLDAGAAVGPVAVDRAAQVNRGSIERAAVGQRNACGITHFGHAVAAHRDAAAADVDVGRRHQDAVAQYAAVTGHGADVITAALVGAAGDHRAANVEPAALQIQRGRADGHRATDIAGISALPHRAAAATGIQRQGQGRALAADGGEIDGDVAVGVQRQAHRAAGCGPQRGIEHADVAMAAGAFTGADADVVVGIQRSLQRGGAQDRHAATAAEIGRAEDQAVLGIAGDDDVMRVEQPLAVAAGRRIGAHRGRPGIQPAARGLDEAAVAAQRAAARTQAAIGPGGLVAPQHDQPAGALAQGIGSHAGAGRHVQGLGVAQHGIAALQATTDVHAAARSAGGIHRRALQQADLPAQQLDGTARAPLTGGHQPAGQQGAAAASVHQQPAAAGAAGTGQAAGAKIHTQVAQQLHLAARAGSQAVGAHDALLVDDGCTQVNPAAAGQHLPQVEDFTLGRADPHRQVGQRAVDQLDAAAGGQQHLATGRLDQALVAHRRATHQHHPATGHRAQLALVDHAGVAEQAVGRAGQAVAPGGPITIADAQRGRHQAGHVDPRTSAEQDTVRVEQPHRAIAGQAAEDPAGVLPQHAVEHLAGGVGLLEAHRLAGADGELLPVQHRTGRIGDGHRSAPGDHCGLPLHHLKTTGQPCRAGGLPAGLRKQAGHCQGQRPQRGPQQAAPAVGGMGHL